MSKDLVYYVSGETVMVDSNAAGPGQAHWSLLALTRSRLTLIRSLLTLLTSLLTLIRSLLTLIRSRSTAIRSLLTLTFKSRVPR